MKITVGITGVQDTRHSLRTIAKQMPFALSLALNRTANSAQQKVRGGLDDRFTLRRKTFIEQSIYRGAEDKATKTKFSAAVRINPARDVLAKHEDGETKRPKSGRSVAIPLPGVKRTKTDVITAANRPRGLQQDKRVFRKGDVLLRRVGRGKRQRLQALWLFRRTATIRPRLAFRPTAERAIADTWAQHAAAAVKQALRTSR